MNNEELIVNKVLITDGGMALKALGNRLYELVDGVSVRVMTNEGAFVYRFAPGFVTNFRSGGILVDAFVDQIGPVGVQLCWLVHDANYTPCDDCNGNHPVSKEYADKLLRAMLKNAGMGCVKRGVVYHSVAMFGRSAYEEDDELTERNKRLFKFSWEAR